MFGFYIASPFLIFALYSLFFVLYNYFSRPYLPVGVPLDNPLVTIFVYAQNSEKSIGKLLQGLSNQNHQNYEVLIYNDLSNDKTVDVISEITAGDKRIRLFNGNDGNNGWIRQNYAYDKLVQIAKGQYYIFTNTEIIIDNQFVANALSHMQRKSLSLLTVFPKVQSQRFLEELKISTFQWIFFSLASAKSFLEEKGDEGAIFSNPILIVEAKAYQSNRWYEIFKDEKNPETKILQATRSLNIKSDSLLGDRSLTYELSDLNCITTNFNVGFVKRRNGLIVYTIAVTLGLFVAIFLLPFPLVFLYLFAVIYSRMLVAMLCQQSVILSLLLMPVQFIVMIQILVKALKSRQ